MRIELEVSEENECTDSPWWIIIDPRQMFKLDVHAVSSMITGPFFSRKEAQEHLDGRRYNYSKHALVYCHSGYYSYQYKTAIRASREKARVFVSNKPDATEKGDGV
jgi:hypothetical protein